MSLQEAIKELKEQLAEEEKKESAEIEAEEEQEVEREAPAPEEEAKPEEEKPTGEAPKPEEKPEEKTEPAAAEEKLDNSAYARMRRETAAAKRKAEAEEAKRLELEATLAALQRVPEETVVAPQPQDPEIEEVKQSLRMTKAEREFQSLEDKFRRANPDYNDIASAYANALAQSIKIQNPRLSNNEIAEKTKQSILYKAAKYMQDGFDPIEELYHEAVDLGFTGKSLAKDASTEEKVEKELKPDMKKVAANRARSTGMTAASGKSEGQMTKQAASDLTVAEWAKLPAEEKRRLLYG